MGLNKYVIKNCPAYSKDALDFCFAKNAAQAICYNCTDCVIKQIVKECTNSLRFSCERILAEKLLGLLDIQEIE